jgi:hypothetical protein
VHNKGMSHISALTLKFYAPHSASPGLAIF